MSEIKTLKDIGEKWTNGNDERMITINEEKLKALAVKWVKEDIEELKYNIRTPEQIIRGWMHRLDIKEEDLK